MKKIERHFCVTVYIFDKKEDKFLFINHKKLNKWLPPGGHVDENEVPDNAAIRECKEETGLDIRLIGVKENFDGALVTPLGIQLNIVKENEHEHIDLIYLAEALNKDSLIINQNETNGIAWINTNEILKADFNTFDSIKYWCKKISTQG